MTHLVIPKAQSQSAKTIQTPRSESMFDPNRSWAFGLLCFAAMSLWTYPSNAQDLKQSGSWVYSKEQDAQDRDWITIFGFTRSTYNGDSLVLTCQSSKLRVMLSRESIYSFDLGIHYTVLYKMDDDKEPHRLDFTGLGNGAVLGNDGAVKLMRQMLGKSRIVFKVDIENTLTPHVMEFSLRGADLVIRQILDECA